MKKMMSLFTVMIMLVVITFAGATKPFAMESGTVEGNIAYVDESGEIWFKEFSTSYYDRDYIQWSVDGKYLIITGSFADTYYYDEYEDDNYFRVRMYDDADDYTDGVDWLIYTHYMYTGSSPYNVYAKIDMSKYGDGNYVFYYDVDCCAYEECYVLIENGEMYVQPWDRDYTYGDVENYNNLMDELNDVDVSNVISDFENSEYADIYSTYMGMDVRQTAKDVTAGINDNYSKARAVYDYLAATKWIRGDKESNELYGAMMNYIGIPTVYIQGGCYTSCTPMVASYIDGAWIVNTVPAPHTNETTYVNVIAGGFDMTPISVLDEMKIDRVSLEVDDFLYVGYMRIEGDMEVRPGQTSKLTLQISEERLRDEPVKWWSNDESIAVVDQNGNVTAVSEGSCLIYAEVDGYEEFVVFYVEDYPKVNVKYNTHIQTYGWECDEEYGYYGCYDCCPLNGEVSGTIGEGKRLEGIKISVHSDDVLNNVDLGVRYTTHCQGYGWLPWASDGDMSGTQGEAKRLEAIMIELTGDDANQYDIYYRVHAQSYGWLSWAKNGEPAGTAGYGKRLEAIQIVVVKKGEAIGDLVDGVTSDCDEAYVAKPGTSPVVNGPDTDALNPVVIGGATPNVAYRTHVQTYGWQGWKYNGQMSGTSGQSKRLEGIEIDITNQDYYGDIVYTTHVQSYGWQDDLNDITTWSCNGEMSGTSGEAKRLEAICIALTDDMGEQYDIYYRVHAQSYGWLGWAKNGEAAGTAGYGKRLEGIQIVLVPKGGLAPDKHYGGVSSNIDNAYVEK